MAAAPKVSQLIELKQLTEDVSNMLFKDHLNTLVKLCEETEDKSQLLPEVEKAKDAILQVQGYLKVVIGARQDRLSSAGRTQDHHRQRSVDHHRQRSVESSKEEVEPAGRSGNGQEGSGRSLQEEKPSNVSNSSTVYSHQRFLTHEGIDGQTFVNSSEKETDERENSIGFMTHPSLQFGVSFVLSDSHTELQDSINGNDVHPGKSKNSSSSLEIANPSTETMAKESHSMDFESNESGKTKSIHSSFLEIANPSFESSNNTESDSMDFESRKRKNSHSSSLEIANPSSESNVMESQSMDFESSDPDEKKKSHSSSLEIANPSTESNNSETHSGEFKSNESGRIKNRHSLSLEIANPSTESNNSETHSGEFKSNESGKSNNSSSSMLEVANPSSEDNAEESHNHNFQSDEPGVFDRNVSSEDVNLEVANPTCEGLGVALAHKDDIADWICKSKFHVVIKPLKSSMDAFSKIDSYSSSTVNCDYFSTALCQYTTPIQGFYEFSVLKIGSEKFKCILRRSDGKGIRVDSLRRRGSSRGTVRWRCTEGEIVWLEGKGESNTRGIAVVFSGSLLKNQES